MHVTYANCFVPEQQLGDCLVTSEACVAESVPSLPTKLLDERFDDAVAEQLNAELWELAFSWYRTQGADPTVISGVSAGDLAGAEAAISILVPAARGILEARAMLEELVPERLTIVNAISAVGNYSRNERVQAEAFLEAVRQLGPMTVDCAWAVSKDPRNDALVRKYASARDPDWLARGPLLRLFVIRVSLQVASIVGRLRTRRSRPSVLVLEYGPTRAFADRYSRLADRDFRLIRLWPNPTEITAAVLAGDLVGIPPRPSDGRSDAVRVRTQKAIEDASEQRFVLEGVDVQEIVLPRLAEIVGRYAAFASSFVPSCRKTLINRNCDAVLVPFDTPPEARLLVRTAQALGVPTFAINDGFKGDDFSREGMTADVAMAWSTAIRDGFFRRRSDGTAVVTGNPKLDRASTMAAMHKPWRAGRLLIGSFTFSPIDLNCRRSDPERFLAEILEGISMLQMPANKVVVKLHPADSDSHYRGILERYSEIPIEVVRAGDVVDMLDGFDIYITTYSTSLIEAVARGVPVVYYRVNDQHHQAPFSGDAYIASRTAASPTEIARLLEDPPTVLSDEARLEWAERYLGPQDGRSVDRIVATIQSRIRGASTS